MVWLTGLFFLVFPWVEFWLLVLFQISLTTAIVQSLLTAGVGWWFARTEGLDLWSELESELANGRLPTEEGLEAMMIVVGGWALMVPGVVTDLLGAALLFPPLRRRAIAPLRAWMRRHLLRGR